MNLIDGRNQAGIQVQSGAVSGRAKTTSALAYVQRTGRVAPKPEVTSNARPQGIGSITGMLDRIGCGWLVLSSTRRLICWSASTETILRGLEDPSAPSEDMAEALWELIGANAKFTPGTMSWIVIRNASDRPTIIAEEGVETPDGSIILALLDRQARNGPNPQTLQKMFGLTPAETNLALQLAKGDAPLEIAEHCHLSRTTIRTQLASLFAKTETRRQSELVSLLGRISLLP